MGSTLPSASTGTAAGQGTYSVFTGTDIYTVFQDMIISTMQGMSYSITRQKAPIYTMGSPDPRAIARSKRGIAGSMIMTTFDRHALADFMTGSQFAGKKGSIENTNANPYKKNGVPSLSDVRNAGSIQQTSPANVGSVLGIGSALQAAGSSATTTMSSTMTPMFTDQLMPFDSTLSAANEYGTGSVMRVFGLEVLNEGSGVSIDDTSNEIQMTYICRLVTPWFNTNKVEAR